MRPTVPARPVTMMVLVSALLLPMVLAAPPAGGQEIVWENRGQPEFGGGAVDIDGNEGVVVASGIVNDESFNGQWFVRAVDLRTGATKWEDRFGPVLFGLAKDVAVHGRRAFVAGWTLNPEGGFVFVVRAYALHSGALLWSREVGRGPRCGEEAPGSRAASRRRWTSTATVSSWSVISPGRRPGATSPSSPSTRTRERGSGRA